jgi:hypothetical protein
MLKLTSDPEVSNFILPVDIFPATFNEKVLASIKHLCLFPISLGLHPSAFIF